MMARARRDAAWAAGAHPVADGIHRIPLPLRHPLPLPHPLPNDGLRAVKIYVHESNDGLLAIDGGWALETSRDALHRALTQIGHSVRSIEQSPYGVATYGAAD